MPNEEQQQGERPKHVTPEELINIGPGPELDGMVHSIVFKLPISGKKKIPTYSKNIGLASAMLERLPIGVGRSQRGDPFYSDERPYWSGHVDYDAIFVANSPALALCKAGIHIGQIVDTRIRQVAAGKLDASGVIEVEAKEITVDGKE